MTKNTRVSDNGTMTITGGEDMKKTALTIVALLLPLMVLATVFQIRQINPEHRIKQALNNNRAWRLSEVVSHYHDGVGWAPENKSTFTYSDIHPDRVVEAKRWNYYYNMDEWLEFMTYAYDYNAAGLITGVSAHFHQPGGPVPWLQATVLYDHQNRLTNMYRSFYDVENGAWVPTIRLHIVYVNNANYTVYQWYSEGDWRQPEYGKINFQYDAQGRIIEELYSTSPDSLNWTPERKWTRIYHPNDTTTGDIIVGRIARLLPLILTSHDEFPPDFFGKASQEIDYYFQGGAWMLDYRTSYTYDNSMRLVHELFEYWGSPGWYPQDFWTYAYDINGNLETRVESYWIMGWVDNRMDAYNWEFYTSITENLAPPRDMISISAYPTPFVDGVNIALQSKSTAPIRVEIFNQKGQLVRRFDAQPNTTVTWDGKSANNRQAGNGIYFVRASQDGMDSSVRKIVKIK